MGHPSAPPTSLLRGQKRKHDDCSQHSLQPLPLGTASSKPSNTEGNIFYYDITPASKKSKGKDKGPAVEKRLKQFRAREPVAFHDIHLRATTQRFYILNRKRRDTKNILEETIQLTGSTGNIYQVRISKILTCNCPHARKGKQCKHIVWCLAKVLRAKHEYVYQAALLSTELRDIFDNAPIDPSSSSSKQQDKRRKPIEGDCPICFCEMETEGEPLVFCQAACGQNLHKDCFETWAATKRQSGGSQAVTCPYCRSVWQGDEDMVRSIKGGKIGRDGYINVADELGISREQDTSTYSHRWSGHYNYY